MRYSPQSSAVLNFVWVPLCFHILFDRGMGVLFSRKSFRVTHNQDVSGNTNHGGVIHFVSTYNAFVFKVAGCNLSCGGSIKRLDSDVTGALFLQESDPLIVIALATGTVQIFKMNALEIRLTDMIGSLHGLGCCSSGLTLISEGPMATIASVGTDGCLHVWHVEIDSGRFVSSLVRVELCSKSLTCVSSIVFDGIASIFCGGNGAFIYHSELELSSHTVSFGKFKAHLSEVNTVDSTKYLGGLIATGGNDRTIRIWSLDDVRNASQFTDIPHAVRVLKRPVSFVRFSHCGQLLLAVAEAELLLFRVVPDEKTHFFIQPVAHQKYRNAITALSWGQNQSKIHICFDSGKLLTLETPSFQST
jgi:WD40 repeat protein